MQSFFMHKNKTDQTAQKCQNSGRYISPCRSSSVRHIPGVSTGQTNKLLQQEQILTINTVHIQVYLKVPTLSMLGKNFSRRQTDDIFPENRVWHFMQIVSLGGQFA